MRTSILISVTALVRAIYAASAEETVAPWTDAPQGQRIMTRLDKVEVIDGANRTEVLYGPYTVPAGKMTTKRNVSAKVPCTGCYVTAMRATLKYPNGTEALTSHGAWLHHTVLGNPAMGVIWAAGNERPTIRLNSQYKYGFDFTGSSMFYTVDLMSERKDDFDVSMAITYEWIEKGSDIGRKYKAATMRWVQILYPLPEPGKKVYKSFPMPSGVNGKLLYTIGHMHDGGTNLKLLINNQTACDSVMYYDIDGKIVKAKQPGAVARRNPQHSHGGEAATFGGAHIASPGACVDYGSIKISDYLSVEAYYDFEQFKTMTHEGKEERLMGNCRVYIGPE